MNGQIKRRRHLKTELRLRFLCYTLYRDSLVYKERKHMNTNSTQTSNSILSEKYFCGIDLASKVIQVSVTRPNVESYDLSLKIKDFDEFIAKHQKMTGNRNKNHYDLLVPETILLPKRRRELRTLICFNSKNQNGMQKNPVFFNNGKGGGRVIFYMPVCNLWVLHCICVIL